MIHRIPYDRSDKDQHRSLLDLLCEAFGDTYLHYYELHLASLATPQSTILLGDSTREVIAHLQIVPYHAALSPLKEQKKCAYLYALCTAKKHQGKGIMSALIREVLVHDLPRMGYSYALLVPADQDLIYYYERLGFRLMTGDIYLKIPRGNYPVIRPGEEAESYIHSAEALDKMRQENRSTQPSIPEYHKNAWLPFQPQQVGWMSHSLTSEALPNNTLLVNPLT